MDRVLHDGEQSDNGCVGFAAESMDLSVSGTAAAVQGKLMYMDILASPHRQGGSREVSRVLQIL